MRWRTGPVTVPTLPSSLVRLDLAAGNYVLFGKAWFQNVGLSTVLVSCDLTAGSESDATEFTLATAGRAEASFALLKSFSGAGGADLNCSHAGGSLDVSANALRITAMKVADITSSEQP